MKKNIKVMALAGLAAVTVVGGTFAYYTATQTFQNPFNTTNYSTSATEKFNPSDGNEWKPGAEVDKDVLATNTGDGNVWVRVKFDENWKKKDGSEIIAWDSSNLNQFDTINYGTYDKAGDHQKDSVDAAGEEISGQYDGITKDDIGTVVQKQYGDGVVRVASDLDLSIKQWYYKDGYFYYNQTLGKNESTTKLLDAVQLCSDTDMGLFHNNEYYIVVPKGTEAPAFPDGTVTETTMDEFGVNTMKIYKWEEGPLPNTDDEKYADKDIYTYKENKLDDDLQGYANANYELNITVEFVQADENGEAAAENNWAWWPGKAEE